MMASEADREGSGVCVAVASCHSIPVGHVPWRMEVSQNWMVTELHGLSFFKQRQTRL